MSYLVLLEGRSPRRISAGLPTTISFSVEAMMLRLEELRLLPGGTWERLRDRGFRVREAQAQLGLARRSPNDSSLPLRYQLLAVRAYEEGEPHRR